MNSDFLIPVNTELTGENEQFLAEFAQHKQEDNLQFLQQQNQYLQWQNQYLHRQLAIEQCLHHLELQVKELERQMEAVLGSLPTANSTVETQKVGELFGKILKRLTQRKSLIYC